MKNPDPSDTIVTTDDPHRLSPIEASIMDWCNLAHAARSRGDAEELAHIGRELDRLLQRYDETDAEGHANPAWARPNQRALVLSARGELEEAIRVELIAVRYADTDRRQEVSLGNIADRLVRLNRPEEAIEYFLRAWDVAPLSVPIMMTGAEAFFKAGRLDDADAIFAAFLDVEAPLIPPADLHAYLRYDGSLLDMAPHLPSLHALYQRLADVDERSGGKS
ncbi:MAG TPA: hypothetical protein ENJ00_04985 [Phycisphaerales bacterium]|nr:hypothetical protein [Phycisphaerales bacterium]